MSTRSTQTPAHRPAHNTLSCVPLQAVHAAVVQSTASRFLNLIFERRRPRGKVGRLFCNILNVDRTTASSTCPALWLRRAPFFWLIQTYRYTHLMIQQYYLTLVSTAVHYRQIRCIMFLMQGANYTTRADSSVVPKTRALPPQQPHPRPPSISLPACFFSAVSLTL